MPSFTTNSHTSSGKSSYDVVIIGGSHAGLAAALTLYRAFHRCLIIDSATPRNQVSTKTHLTPGWENKDPQHLRGTCRAELEQSGLVDFISSKAISAQRGSDGLFEVVDSEGKEWLGRKLLLAIGMRDVYPDIQGYAENYGRRIYYCMFCYGSEHRGQSRAGLLATGLLGTADNAITNAQDALKHVDRVTIFTNGDPALITKSISARLPQGIDVDDHTVEKIVKDENSTDLDIHFTDGEPETIAFLVHKPDMVLDSTLPDQLKLETAPFLGIKVSPPFNQTNVEGVFAAGDCCSPLRMISNAMAMGSFAGCGIARQLPKNIGDSIDGECACIS